MFYCEKCTMTVNSAPRISRSLALLEDYRRTVAATAAREDELTKDIVKRRYAAERKYQNALKDSSARLTREITEADKLWKSRYETTRERHGPRGRQQRRLGGLKHVATQIHAPVHQHLEQ